MRSGTTPRSHVAVFLLGWLGIDPPGRASRSTPSRMVQGRSCLTRPGSSADLIARNLGPPARRGLEGAVRWWTTAAGASGIHRRFRPVAGRGPETATPCSSWPTTSPVRRRACAGTRYDPVKRSRSGDPCSRAADLCRLIGLGVPSRRKSFRRARGHGRRASPGRIYYASPGSGLPAPPHDGKYSSPPMASTWCTCPTRTTPAGGPPDLVGGQVSLMFASVGVAPGRSPKAGRIRILSAGPGGREKNAQRARPKSPSFHRVGREGLQTSATWFANAGAERDPAPKSARNPTLRPTYRGRSSRSRPVAELMPETGNDARGRNARRSLHDSHSRSDFERWDEDRARKPDIKGRTDHCRHANNSPRALRRLFRGPLLEGHHCPPERARALLELPGREVGRWGPSPAASNRRSTCTKPRLPRAGAKSPCRKVMKT